MSPTKSKTNGAKQENDALDLFAPAADVDAGTKGNFVFLELSEIETDPAQPRRDADADLEQSIRQEGVLQPITVRPHPDPVKVKAGVRYLITYGERRYRGSVAAGRATIPAIIRDDSEDEARRLIRQCVENTAKPLPPLEEAVVFKRIQELTGASVAQLAKTLGKAKSTIGDRLALADAPAPFKELFLEGSFTAAAAPIAKKFAHVPAKSLERAIESASSSWQWEGYRQDKKPIPLKEIEPVLERALGFSGVQEVPENLSLLFQGDTFDLGGKKMTADLKALEKAQATFNTEQEKLAKKTGVKKGTKPPKAKEEKWQIENRLREERWNREAAKRRAESARFNKAAPAILAAFAEKMLKAPTGITANATSAIAELVLKACEGQGATKDALKPMPVGTNAESILRHAAYLCVVNVAAQSYLRERQMPALAKRFGVDLKAIIEAAAPAKKEVAEPKTAKPKAKKAAKKTSTKKSAKKNKGKK